MFDGKTIMRNTKKGGIHCGSAMKIVWYA